MHQVRVRESEMAERRAVTLNARENLYSQLYDIVFQDIINHVYKVGDRIPSETELMKRYDVSRITARRAMEMLAANGLIEKRRGFGSVVISNVPDTSLQHVRNYECFCMRQGALPSKVQVDASIIPAGRSLAKQLQVDEGTSLYRLCRLHLLDSEPAFIEFNYYENERFPEAIVRDFSRESLRSYVNNECGVVWKRANQTISASCATVAHAKFLGVPEGSALIHVTRISYDQHDEPREFVDSFYRPDYYRMEIELDR